MNKCKTNYPVINIFFVVLPINYVLNADKMYKMNIGSIRI